MNKTVMAILIGLIAIIGITIVVLTNRTDPSSSPQQTQQPDSNASTSPPDNQTDTSLSEQASSELAAESIKVSIRDFAFAPQEVTVKKGSTIAWTNDDSVQHSVVPDNPSSDFGGSDLLSRGQTYEWTFDTPGTYTYHCGPHPNMTGKITVE